MRLKSDQNAPELCDRNRWRHSVANRLIRLPIVPVALSATPFGCGAMTSDVDEPLDSLRITDRLRSKRLRVELVFFVRQYP